MPPKLSVIVPTTDVDDRSISLCLLSLTHQSAIRDAEVVIVDNSEGYRCAELATAHSGLLDVSVVKSAKHGNRAAARNLGARKARGQVLVFVDDDVLLPRSETLAVLVDLAGGRKFVCGARRYWTYHDCDRNRVKEEAIRGEFLYVLRRSFVPRQIDPVTGFLRLLDVSFLGHFGAIRRDLFWSVGGFDEGYEGWGREDCDLMYRLLVVARLGFAQMPSRMPIIHLTHPGPRQENPRTERRFARLERRHGMHLRFSTLLGKREFEDPRILVPLWENADDP